MDITFNENHWSTLGTTLGWKYGKVHTKNSVNNKILGSLKKWLINIWFMGIIIYFFTFVCIDFKS
jgi:hypothetical protein